MKNKDKEKFPYSETPTLNAFPGEPEDCFDIVNRYGTYEIQRTADTENFFPPSRRGFRKTWSWNS